MIVLPTKGKNEKEEKNNLFFLLSLMQNYVYAQSHVQGYFAYFSPNTL